MALQIPETWLHRLVRVWLIGAGGTGSQPRCGRASHRWGAALSAD